MLVTVVILNYQGKIWIQRCLESVLNQTIRDSIEIMVVDNDSVDGSWEWARDFLAEESNASVVPYGENLGYCEANNRAALVAKGDYLFFLNNDAWLEPDCLEKLVDTAQRLNAQASCPLVMNYEDSSFQSSGALGLDVFGLPTCRFPLDEPGDVLMPEGCGYFVDRELFIDLGGFDPLFYMYSDEFDFSLRLWACGYRAVTVPEARMHHRGAAHVNPEGGEKAVEFRTSDLKRFYANRNALLTLLNNGQDLLLIMAGLQLLMLVGEAIMSLLIVRRISHVRQCYLDAILDCWRHRRHWLRNRERLHVRRKRSDLELMSFFKFRLNRWDEVLKVIRYGWPRVTRSK